MKILPRILHLFTLFALLWNCEVLRAQSGEHSTAPQGTQAPDKTAVELQVSREVTTNQSINQSKDQDTEKVGEPASDKSIEISPVQQYAASLDGSGLIRMESGQQIKLNFGGSIAAGFDSNPSNLGTSAGSAVFSYSPYVGMQASTPRTQYLLQYHPTFTSYSSYASRSMQVVSATVTGSSTPRLSWSLGMNGSHGNDSVRLLTPSQPIAVGGVPTTGSSAGSFLANAGDVTNFDVGLDVHYRVSQRDSVSYRVGDSYISYPALHNTGKVATADFVYERSLKPNLGVVGYGQSAKYYGDLGCTTYGGGIGLRWQPRENALVSVKGGPQLDSPGCKSQQGFSYSASVTMKVLARAQFFLTADRVPVAGFLGAGLWQDDISGGYERRIFTDTITIDAGYVHSSTLLNRGSYEGRFFDTTYLHPIRKGLNLACSYRNFSGNSGGTGISRDTLSVSLVFTPNTRSLSQ